MPTSVVASTVYTLGEVGISTSGVRSTPVAGRRRTRFSIARLGISLPSTTSLLWTTIDFPLRNPDLKVWGTSSG